MFLRITIVRMTRYKLILHCSIATKFLYNCCRVARKTHNIDTYRHFVTGEFGCFAGVNSVPNERIKAADEEFSVGTSIAR